jgi:hypothetical protein
MTDFHFRLVCMVSVVMTLYVTLFFTCMKTTAKLIFCVPHLVFLSSRFFFDVAIYSKVSIVNISITYVCDIEPCHVVEAYRSYGGAYSIHNQDNKAASTSETSVNFCHITRATSLKTAMFTLADTRTSNLTSKNGILLISV